MRWEVPLEDRTQEKAWRRLWLRFFLVMGVYGAAFVVFYFRWKAHYPDPDVFFWNQRILTRYLLAVMGIHFGITVFLYRRVWLYKWRRFFHAPLPPHQLAAARILLFGMLTTDLVFFASDHWAPFAALPESSRVPLSLTEWYVPYLPITPGLYQLAWTAGIVLGFMAMFGLFTRAAIIGLIPITMYVAGVPQFFGKLSHNHFFVWCTIFMACAPSAAIWSLDALRYRLRGIRVDRRPSLQYALAIRWLMLTLAGIYFFSGIHKLYDAGLYWAMSDNPVNLLRTEWLEQFQQVPFLRPDLWPLLCNIAAFGTIAFELAYPFLLLGAQTRVLAALGAIAFHNMTGYFMKIDFSNLKGAHLPYFNLRWVAVRMQRFRPRLLAWIMVVAAWGLLAPYVGVFFAFPIVLLTAFFSVVWGAIPNRKRVVLIQRLRRRRSRGSSRAAWQFREQWWFRVSLVTGAAYLILNSSFGLFGIHSWPFSAYPSYAFVRAATIEYAWFLPVTADGRVLDLDVEAQKIGFRKENILPMAESVVAGWRYEASALVPRILLCWERWQLEVPALREAVRAEVVVREYPLDPDHYGEVIAEIPLGTLQLQAGEWIFSPSVLQQP